MQTCTAWMVVFRSVLMSLIMTFMFEPAKLQMNCASASGISIFRSDARSSWATVLVIAAHHHVADDRSRSARARACTTCRRVSRGP